MSDIPGARRRLLELAASMRDEDAQPDMDLVAKELDAIVLMLWREPAVRAAPKHSVFVTPGLAEAIRATAKAHPDWSEFTIGVYHGCNQGRVSEALRDLR